MNNLITLLTEKVKPLYDEPTRFYHTWKHIEKCLGEFEEIKGDVSLPIALELAILYHDAIYKQDNLNHNDELASAELVMNHILNMKGIPLKEMISIDAHDLILCTKYHLPNFRSGLKRSSKYIIDIDLSIFGAPEPEFWEYEDNIKKEYSFVPDNVYNTERTKIIEGFLECESIYFTEYFRNKYETQARKNLDGLIGKLK